MATAAPAPASQKGQPPSCGCGADLLAVWTRSRRRGSNQSTTEFAEDVYDCGAFRFLGINSSPARMWERRYMCAEATYK
eukprot:6184362-Pleurochrysis_carterae.AAC.1